MSLNRALFVPVACLALAGCSKAHIYGPSSDERLEKAATEGVDTSGLEVAELKCADLQQKIRQIRVDDRTEDDRLQALTDVFVETEGRFNKIEEATQRNPDLIYGAQAEAVKANLDDCRATLADARSDLDRYVREVAEMPVIQELHGNRTTNAARMDFDVVRAAIEALKPDDKDLLLAKIENAEKKVGPKPSAKPASSKKK